jgi:uncharacterized protein YecE (DUF72 family)
MKPVHIGCSGWNYKSWRETFYPVGLPQRQWLERYAEAFDTVEVNNTFYRLPKRDAVANWVERTPKDFIFTVKASRYLTHIKRLDMPAEGIGRFYERIEPLAVTPKMGPVLWQLPANFRRDDERLEQTLAMLPPGRHAFEFRHESWFVPDVTELLRAHGAALAIGDHPDRPFQTHEITADWTFLRMHHGHRGRRGNYSQSELETWRRRIAQWRRKAEVFVYFNNDWEEFAIRNALWLRDRFPSK